MTTPPNTVQAVASGALPIVALSPPPEGQKGASITFTIPAGLTTAGQLLQLNSPGSLGLSQVVTLCVDNSQNSQPLTIIHGAFNENIVIGAGAYQVFPTFSTKGFYNISLSVPVAPSAEIPVNIVFLNYDRRSSSFTNNPSSSGQASAVLYGDVTTVTAVGNTSVLPPANWIFDDIMFSIDALQFTAAGTWQIQAYLNNGSAPGGLAALIPAGTAGAAGWGAPFARVSRSWPQGIAGQANKGVTIEIQQFVNLTAARIAVNISGIRT